MKLVLGMICAGGLALGAGMANAATIVNGSFEADPVVSTGLGFDKYNGGDTGITGWGVGGHSVDIVDASLWVAQDGVQAVDLDGEGPGSIFQMITGLVSSYTYTVSFWMSGNDAGAPNPKSMDVSVGMNAAQTYTFDTSNGGAADDEWEMHTYVFTAAATSALLTFSSNTAANPSAFGPALDNVSISGGPAAIPVPAAGLLLLTGLGALSLGRRKRS